MKPLTLGTAGHVDHGKTALVKALTGVDTDRLPEEHERGISIELGYAPLSLPSGRRLSVIDVPGHERLVRTMVAGATGIDVFLMTIAADDGVMPQTREHAAVLDALEVRTGVVAITKTDLADPAAAIAQAKELLPDAPAIAVCATSGSGLDELKAALDRAVATRASRADSNGPTRLHIDRVFTIKGAGTVITGTLWSGTISRGQDLLLLPQRARVRVRGVEIHDQPVDEAHAGQRVALNLTGINRSDVERGDVLTAANTKLEPTYRIDATLSFANAEPEHGDRVQVHHGTRESPARLAWLGGSFWQLRLEHELIPSYGDRLVIRQIAPPDTIGGGRVLDPQPKKHGPGRDLLTRLNQLVEGPEAQASVAAADARDSRKPVTGTGPRRAPPSVPIEQRDLLIERAKRNDNQLTLAQARDALGTSREQARLVLQRSGLFIRRDDVHVLRRAYR